MKKMIKSRRGIAIELAVGVMFIFVALSIVLISISGMQAAHKNTDLNDFTKKRDLYEITDYIMDNHDSFKDGDPIEEKTIGEKEIGEKKYTIRIISSKFNVEVDNESVEKTEYKYTVVLPAADADSEEITVLVIKVIDGKISSWED